VLIPEASPPNMFVRLRTAEQLQEQANERLQEQANEQVQEQANEQLQDQAEASEKSH